MLSDEEKEALEKLSGKKNETTWNDTIRQIKREEIKDVVVTRQKYITIILNLIEKQSKEIEELKEQCKEVVCIPEGTCFMLEPKDINKKWKDKIKEILGIEEDIDNEKLLSLLQTIVDENARLEDIEDRKVQIEYNNVFNKGVKSIEDKIKAKIEEYDKTLYYAETEEGMAELKDYEYDEAKYGIKVLQSLLEKE